MIEVKWGIVPFVTSPQCYERDYTRKMLLKHKAVVKYFFLIFFILQMIIIKSTLVFQQQNYISIFSQIEYPSPIKSTIFANMQQNLHI